MVRRYVRGILIVLAILATAAAGAGHFFYQAVQHEPAFYRQAMRIEPQQHAQAGDELEQEMIELQNEVRRAGHWEAVFTEEQINGWLASDMPEKFPGILPAGVESPRVAIEDGEVKIAARYQDKLMTSVISIVLDVCLTDESNTLAVTIKKIRAGALPVPIRQFLDRISRRAERNDIELRWSQDDGAPVALVTIPHRRSDYAHREIYVETIELRDGAVYLAGRTDEAEPPPAEVLPTEVAQRSGPLPPGENVIFQR